MALTEAESKVLACFKEQHHSILREEELKSCWGKNELQNTCDDCLKKMVDCGRLGRRTLNTEKRVTTVYWLKEQCSVSETAASKSGTSSSAVTPESTRQKPKRLRTSFVSPLIKDSREKRPKLNHSPPMAISSVVNRLDSDKMHQGEDKEVISKNSSCGYKDQLHSLERERETLLTQLRDHREKLRKLKMVKMYRTKNDLQGLDELASKWREVAQDAAQCLLESSTSQPRPSMQQLLNYLHIDSELIQYSTEDESFY